MALNCQLSLNYASYAPGQNPPPMATLTVVNPGAVPVLVTGVTMSFTDQFGNKVRPPVNVPQLAIGPGQNVLVSAAGSLTIGPFPIAVGSAANGNGFQMVPPGSLPPNPQGSQPLQSILVINALVNGSDGSSNVAGSVALLVSYTSTPPLGYQGGALVFSVPNNSIGLTPGWP